MKEHSPKFMFGGVRFYTNYAKDDYYGQLGVGFEKT